MYKLLKTHVGNAYSHLVISNDDIQHADKINSAVCDWI